MTYNVFATVRSAPATRHLKCLPDITVGCKSKSDRTTSSYNCKNIKTSLLEIRELCNSSDLIFLQETWLSSDDLHIFSSIDKRFYGQGVSAINDETGVSSVRPHGGLAILWRKTLKGCKVKDLHCTRVMAFQMEEDNVYMPCNARDSLDDIEHVLTHLSSTI